MPNTPVQFPNYDLPGFEFFASPSGQQPLSIERRGAVSANSAVAGIGVLGAANATVSITIDPTFGQSKAVYFDRIRLSFYPSDGSRMIQIVGTQVELQCPPGQPIMDIGFPLATLNSPAFRQVVSVEQDWLLTYPDAVGMGTGVSPGNLIIISNVQGLNLDSANTHNFSITLSAVFTIVSGLLT